MRTACVPVHFDGIPMHLTFAWPLPSHITPYTLVKKGRAMKIKIETDESLREPEIIVRCAVVDDRIVSIVADLRMHDRKMTGDVDGETRVVSVGEIIYVESVEGRSFAYTGDAVLEMPLRLCELEERLVDVGFVKVARNCLVNLCRIAGLRPYVGGRLLARLDNDEEIVISRKYAGEIRRQLNA